jgi:hypothetical protein
MKKGALGWCWWLIPVILTTEETEIRSILVQSHPGQIVHETRSRKKNITKKGWWSGLSEILSSNPSALKKKKLVFEVGVWCVVQEHNNIAWEGHPEQGLPALQYRMTLPHSAAGIERASMVRLKGTIKRGDIGAGGEAKWWSAWLANVRSCVQSLVPPKKERGYW